MSSGLGVSIRPGRLRPFLRKIVDEAALVSDSTWTEYYNEHEDREPREMLIRVLDAFGPGEREAIDLGCGSGIDTLAMLRAGWRVFATDAELEGIHRLRARVPDDLSPHLRVELGRMEGIKLPPADLVWAGFSLFFCPPDRFGDVWARIRGALRPGGRFAGHLLGDRDTWAPGPGISSFSRGQALALFDSLEIEHTKEEDEDGDACSGPKHWHVFHVVARRPA